MSVLTTTARLALAAGALALAARAARSTRAVTFNRKTALITGGSRGLGLMLSQKLLQEGARVAILARDEDELERAAEHLRPYLSDDARLHTIACDLRDAEATLGACAEAARVLGSIDLLINNAGIIQVGPLDTITEGDFRDALDTHLWGPLRTIQATLPGMRARRAGRIVNITSIGAVISPPHLIPYSTSKYALRGMSEGLRHELAGSGVSVTTVCPGLMRTGSTARARFKGRHREEHAWFTIADAMPILSSSASSAADAILNAARHGDPHLTIGLPAKLASAAQGLAPGLVTKVMELTAQQLPGMGGIGIESRPGYQSTSRLAPSMLTKLDSRAARKLNELPAS